MININQSVCHYLNTNLFIITELADILFNSLKSMSTSLFLLLQPEKYAITFLKRLFAELFL